MRILSWTQLEVWAFSRPLVLLLPTGGHSYCSIAYFVGYLCWTMFVPLLIWLKCFCICGPEEVIAWLRNALVLPLTSLFLLLSQLLTCQYIISAVLLLHFYCHLYWTYICPFEYFWYFLCPFAYRALKKKSYIFIQFCLVWPCRFHISFFFSSISSWVWSVTIHIGTVCVAYFVLCMLKKSFWIKKKQTPHMDYAACLCASSKTKRWAIILLLMA